MIAPGLRGVATLDVGPESLVGGYARLFPAWSDLPPTAATITLIGLMETACLDALDRHLPPGTISLGVGVDIRHLAPAAEGTRLEATAELLAVDGRLLTFEVACRHAAETLAVGQHRRALADRARFLERLTSSGHG